MLDIVCLELELEEKLGRKVDIVEYSAIKPWLKDIILKDERIKFMRNKNPKILLFDILESIEAIEKHIKKISFGVNMERVWDMAKNDIPKLKKQTSELLEKF